MILVVCDDSDTQLRAFRSCPLKVDVHRQNQYPASKCALVGATTRKSRDSTALGRDKRFRSAIPLWHVSNSAEWRQNRVSSATSDLRGPGFRHPCEGTPTPAGWPNRPLCPQGSSQGTIERSRPTDERLQNGTCASPH